MPQLKRVPPVPLPLAAVPPAAVPPAAALGDVVLGTVRSVLPSGCQALMSDGALIAASLATHLTLVEVGQSVVLMQVAPDDWLVIAAKPLPGSVAALAFDPLTGTLSINAPRLRLSALGTVELRCGDASIVISMDGRVALQGQDILSSAVASHRIEGASIDLN